MLVSNSFAELGSSGPAPLVAVCGAVSSFVTVITSPFVTVSVSGAYAGFPGVAAPAGIEIEGPDEAGAVALDAVVAPVLAVSDAAPGALVGAGGWSRWRSGDRWRNTCSIFPINYCNIAQE